MSGNARNADTKNRELSDSKLDNPAQSKRFIEAARERKADETEEGADRAFKQATKHPKPKAR